MEGDEEAAMSDTEYNRQYWKATTVAMREAKSAGFKAFNNGTPIWKNPHYRKPLWRAWKKGYAEAAAGARAQAGASPHLKASERPEAQEEGD